MQIDKLTFRVHALQRMSQRHIGPGDVRKAVERGEVIEKYPDDKPYPSCLVLGWHEGRPLHIVIAEVPESHETVVITVYEPNPAKWDSDLRRRRP